MLAKWKHECHSYIEFLQPGVALVCVIFLRFATQGCAGRRNLIVFCNSAGLRWSA